MTDRSTTNVVLIMTDQQRHGFTAGEGLSWDTMPFCDALAATGRRFAHGFTPSPACVPARTSLLTGRYPSTHRVRQNSTNGQVVRGDDLVDVVSAAGHQTVFVGKPHMYRGADDFDQWSGPFMHTSAPQGTAAEEEFTAWLASIDHGPTTEPTPHELEVQYPYRIVDEAIAHLQQRDRSRPTMLWVSFPEPHNPYQVCEPYWSMFDPGEAPERSHGPEGATAKGGAHEWLRRLLDEKRPGYDEQWRRYRATYCGMLRMIDDQIARLHEVITAELGDDTMIIFVSDHGDYVGEYGLQRKGAGMTDALMRVPFWITGPGVTAARDEVSAVSLVDLLPTIAELVGQPIPLGAQGRSLLPVLRGDPEPTPQARRAFATAYAERGFGGLPYGPEERPELHYPYAGTQYDELNTVTQSGSSRMVHDGRWKLISHSDGLLELYDVALDPAEMDDRIDDPDAVPQRDRLMRDLVWWLTNLGDELPDGVYRSRRPEHNWHGAHRRVTATHEVALSTPRITTSTAQGAS